MNPTLQSIIKKSRTVSYPLIYYRKEDDTIYVVRDGKILERLEGWQMAYAINTYVGMDCKHKNVTPLAGDIYAGDKDYCDDCGRTIMAV
jgi:hypothetical protein